MSAKLTFQDMLGTRRFYSKPATQCKEKKAIPDIKNRVSGSLRI